MKSMIFELALDQLPSKVIQRPALSNPLGKVVLHFIFEEAWDDGYLAARCPNPININPFYTLKDHTQPEFQRPISLIG